MPNTSQESSSLETMFPTVRRRYAGGEIGYKELLEIDDAGRRCKRFVVVERGEDEGGAMYRFSEWRSLETADVAFGAYRMDLTALKGRPGFMRFVDVGHQIPWFYAEPGDLISREEIAIPVGKKDA